MIQQLENKTSEETGSKPGEGFSIQLSPRKIFCALTILVVSIAVVGTIANLIIYQVAPSPDHAIARLMRRIDLGHEPSIPAWYSSLALFVSSVLLLVIAEFKRKKRQTYFWHWLGLSAVFFLMAIDEAVMIHEMVANSLQRLLNTSGIFYFAWVIPAMLSVVFMGIVYFKFLGHLTARTRNLFLIAGSCFVIGAVGMEMIAGLIYEQYGLTSIAHSIEQFFEELGEMLGVVIFIYALLEYIGNEIGPIRLQISDNPQEIQ